MFSNWQSKHSKHSNVLYHFSVLEAASENVLGKRDILKNGCTGTGQVETAIKNQILLKEFIWSKVT